MPEVPPLGRPSPGAQGAPAPTVDPDDGLGPLPSAREEPADLVSLSQKAKDWTVMIYADGANDLDEDTRVSVEQLVAKGAPDNANVLVREASRDGRVTDFRVTSAAERSAGAPEMVSVPGGLDHANVDMGKPASLASFMSESLQRSPAEHTMLIVDGHGGDEQGVAPDDPHHDHMSLSGLAQALDSAKAANQGRPIDEVQLNACEMSSAEVASELEGRAQVLSGSEDVAQAPVSLVAEVADAARSSDARQLGKTLVADPALNPLTAPAGFDTMSAIDLGRMGPVERSLKDFSSQLQERASAARQGDAAAASSIQAANFDLARSRHIVEDSTAPQPNGNQHVDLEDFASKVAGDPYLQENDPSLARSAGAVAASVKDAVIAERHPQELAPEPVDPRGAAIDERGYRAPGAHGMSIVAPLDSTGEEAYADVGKDGLLLNESTDWAEGISALGYLSTDVRQQ